MCGFQIEIKKELVYTAVEPRSFADCLSKPETKFSAIDCPNCGCQIMLAIRAPKVEEETEDGSE